MGNLYRRRRGGGGHSSSIDLNFDLSSVNSARFAFAIIFALWALYLALRCLRVLRAPGTYLAAYIVLLFAILLSLTDDVMDAVAIATIDNLGASGLPQLGPVFVMMWSWVFIQADILFAVALLLYIIHRTSRATLPIWKVVIDAVFVVTWTCLMIACLGMYSSLIHSTVPKTLAAYNAYKAKAQTYEDLTYATHAFQIATTIDITVSSLLLWLQMRRMQYQDKIIRHIALVVCPLILVRAFYGLAAAIVSNQTPTLGIDWDAFGLASEIVEGLLIYTAIYMFLGGKESKPKPPVPGVVQQKAMA